MLPSVGADTPKIARYAAEVGGRALGVAAMPNLVPDANRRAALETAAQAIIASAKQLTGLYVARVIAEYVDQRVLYGRGKGIDRGFDAVVSNVSEAIRTSLPDRNTRNPEYLAIFPNGAEEFSSPTIKEDEALAVDLRKAVSDSSLSVKAGVIELLDTVIPVVGPAAAELREGEKQLNTLFQAELNGRKVVIDTLWEQRKAIETALGRGGRGVARFIYFDFRKGGADGSGGEDGTQTPPQNPPAAPETT